MTFITRLSVGCSFAMLLYGQVVAQGIYTCVDAKGRKISSDRPIAECMDRVQKEITPTGTVKRVLMPLPSAQEQAVLEEKEKQDVEDRDKATKEKLRDRALLKRYPDVTSHNKERGVALERVNEDIKMATQRSEGLTVQRKGIMTELEFYKNSPGKAPQALIRQLDEADANIVAQKRLIADQEAEKKRITQRYDTEMAKLKVLWDVAGGATSVAVVPNSVKKP